MNKSTCYTNMGTFTSISNDHMQNDIYWEIIYAIRTRLSHFIHDESTWTRCNNVQMSSE